MATTIPRFEPATTTSLRHLLLVRRASLARRTESLRREAVDALSQRDLSDMLDHDDPSADADGAAALMLIQHAEERHWEVEQALTRIDSGTYGYCMNCGAGIPLERLRALPATTTCVACSHRSSHRIRARIGIEPGAARRAHWKSPSIRDASEPEVEQ